MRKWYFSNNNNKKKNFTNTDPCYFGENKPEITDLHKKKKKAQTHKQTKRRLWKIQKNDKIKNKSGLR